MFRLCAILLTLIHVSAGARILAIVPSPSISHQVIFQPIFKELAKRGHELVVITTDLQNDATLPNLKEIDLSSSYNIWRRLQTEILSKSNPISFFSAIVDLFGEISTNTLEHPEVQVLIKNETEHFDLVMIEYVTPAVFAFKHRFNCPLIIMQSTDTFMANHIAVGNSVHQVLYPEGMVGFTGELNFFQRLTSFAMGHFYNQYMGNYYTYIENEKVSKYFGEGYPHLKDIRDSVDMLFVNVNPIFAHVRPITPATISIGGGIHIKERKPLPKDIQTFLDSGEIIYFSLGSNVKSADIPLDTREIILKVFSELPYKVLWKFELEDMPNKPKNVKIQKWMPQQDVLRHPNIKLFITQGGLQSAEEALFSHIPLIVMPYAGDQEFNAQKMVDNGIGVSINHKTLTEKEFKDALLEVIKNPKYKNQVIKLATRVRDEPMNALQKAVWWTEYVVRNKGAQHLKGPGLNLPLYQYYYLDIFAFIICLIFVVVLVFYFVTKKILSFFCKLVCTKKVKQH